MLCPACKQTPRSGASNTNAPASAPFFHSNMPASLQILSGFIQCCLCDISTSSIPGMLTFESEVSSLDMCNPPSAQHSTASHRVPYKTLAKPLLHSNDIVVCTNRCLL